MRESQRDLPPPPPLSGNCQAASKIRHAPDPRDVIKTLRAPGGRCARLFITCPLPSSQQPGPGNSGKKLQKKGFHFKHTAEALNLRQPPRPLVLIVTRCKCRADFFFGYGFRVCHTFRILRQFEISKACVKQSLL